MSDAADGAGRAGWPLGAARVAIGVAQGFALYGLTYAARDKTWPATVPPLFAALSMALSFVPLVIIGGLGHLRRGTLAIWTLVCAAVAGGLAAYAVATGVPRFEMASPALEPDFPVVMAIAAFVFIAHHLIVPADARRRWLATYRDYFDVGWLDAAQLGLAAVFTGVFWLVLELGAQLFNLIGITAFRTLIQHDWFYYPATGLAFAAGLHLADIRVGLTRGVRTIGLFLLSWLAPLMTLIAVGFLVSLIFTGLTPLWASRLATGVLLWAITVLVVLINATYRDGLGETVNVVLRWTARIAAVALVPIAAVAALGLWLRIHQHGLTPERIIAAAFLLVAVVYAVGYAIAAIVRGPWMRRLEATNIAAAFLILALIVALFSPIADPRPISIRDQVSRLETGAVAPDKFDFAFLRFNAGTAGVKALEALAAQRTGPNAALIAQDAASALKLKNFYQTVMQPPPPTAFTLYPKGAAWPAGLLAALRDHEIGCAYGACRVFPVALAADGSTQYAVSVSAGLHLYAQSGKAGWTWVGKIDGPICPEAIADLKAGRETFAPPAQHWKDLIAGGQRLAVAAPNDYVGCPPMAKTASSAGAPARPTSPAPPGSPAPKR
ncbi:MAG: DUF4153 domain-containing protein [Caulobacteraceae bacterium]